MHDGDGDGGEGCLVPGWFLHTRWCASVPGWLLWGDTMVDLLPGVAQRPVSREFAGRARDAAVALLRLNSPQTAPKKTRRRPA
jgi:hypothetical protein